MPSSLLSIYERLLAAYGPQDWWPADSPFEVIVGAILTQRVSWTNVEEALAALRAAGLMDPERLAAAAPERISSLIRPCLYYNAKTRKLQAFVRFLLEHHDGSLDRLFSLPTGTLRQALLLVHGIGEETADAILLYAAGRPSFVVDAYTRRILSRLGLMPHHTAYRAIQDRFAAALPRDAAVYGECHALLVRHGKTRCRSRGPRCDGCPLSGICTFPEAQ